MKKIGHTETGNTLVEMTNKEEAEFVKLGWAIEGHGFDREFFLSPSLYADVSLTDVFSVIRAWYIAKYRVNELRDALDTLDNEVLGNKNE